MAMTSRERVLAALNFQETDRIPIDLGGYPAATSINVRAYQEFLKHLGIDRNVLIANLFMYTAEIDDDILDRFQVDTKSLALTISTEEFGTPEKYTDLWHAKWVLAPDFTYAPLEGPFQRISKPTLQDLESFAWPEPSKLQDFEKLREKAKRARGDSDRALIGCLPAGIFYWAQILRGLENWLVDLVIHPEFCEAFHEKLLQIWLKAADCVLDALGDNVDVLMTADDFGVQQQPLVSPTMFREKLKPYMKKMVDSVKKKTKAPVGLHCCGSVYSLMDDFVDIGLDILNPLQSNAKDMEADKIKEKTKGRMALWGGIDTHNVLPNGSPDEVREEVKRKISIFKKGGGYIFCGDHNILMDIPPENIVTMYEAALEYA